MDGEGWHAGDLPNIHAGDDGIARADYSTERVTLASGAEAGAGTGRRGAASTVLVVFSSRSRRTVSSDTEEAFPCLLIGHTRRRDLRNADPGGYRRTVPYDGSKVV